MCDIGATMDTNINDIYRKIQNCLNLSKSSNEFEAAMAIKQAQALMKKYNISDRDLLLSEIKEKIIETDSKRYKFTEVKLAATVASIFQCGFYWLIYKNKGRDYIFYGIEPNTTIAIYAYEVLLPIIKEARKNYIASLHGNTKLKNKRKLGDQFTLGWLDAVRTQCENLLPDRELENKLKQYKEKTSIETRPHKEIDYDQLKLLKAKLDGSFEGSKVKLHHGLSRPVYEAIGG